jgi:C-terminal processing protease CtpA/Prc
MFAGGKHTFLKTESEVTEDATSTDWEMPSVSIESDGIAVIKLPPFSGNHDEGIRYAKTVLDAVPDDIKGVVIDLRDNRGGNMYPMIAAVHRFIADDDILRFRTRKRTQWIQLPFVIQGTGVERMNRIECPVAILTNEWTASSGEATLLCFRGLDYVRVFGSSTAGYASANQPFPLPGGDQLILTTGCDVARTGEVFCDDPIEPDQLTETPLEDALEWIKTKN